MKTKNKRIIVVTGGRDYQLCYDERFLFMSLLKALGATEVYHGGARGADQDASEIAETMSIPIRVFIPDYRKRDAPRNRNIEMLRTAITEAGKENVVLVIFPGGGGTAHTFETGIEFGVPCVDLSPLRR